MSDTFPLPDLEWEPAREFFSAASRGELVIPRCAGCRTYQWYPGDACRACGSEELPWEPVCGRGALFSWAVVHRALAKSFGGQVPFVTALVSLEEDPAVRVVTRIVDCAAEELRVDMPVRVVFREISFDDTPASVVALMFAPVAAEAGGRNP